jgi:hypothetical protein
MIKKTKLIFFFLIVTLGIEAAVRLSGLVDFPTYNVDAEIGYVPKENQSGAFLNKNDWVFNDKSMPIAQNWSLDSSRKNVLLIGNSIIMGGGPFRQHDKLTPQIQARLGDRMLVWPLATGGWTEVNEMVDLDRHPEVTAHADYFAWEYMAGGLSQATPWGGEYVFPTHRPIFATWYVFRRYVLPRFFLFLHVSELPVTGQVNSVHLAKFDVELGSLVQKISQPHAGILWLYPKAAELTEARQGKEWLPERPEIEQLANKYGLTVIDVAAKPEWNRSLYRDDGVHPTVEGNRVLATILSSEILAISSER